MNQKTVILLGALLLLVGCAGAGNATAVATPASMAITCHTAYRTGNGQPIVREDSFTLAEPGRQSEGDVGDLHLTAVYNTGEGEGGSALAIQVRPTGSDEPITSQLYQFAPGAAPQNEFVGGHGFTGLTYVYHPVSASELQFWCATGTE